MHSQSTNIPACYCLQYYAGRYPEAEVVSHRAQLDHARPNFLTSHARFYSHFVLGGHRIVASDSLAYAPNSVIQVAFGAQRYVGQIFKILRHYQARLGADQSDSAKTTLLYVKWFRRLQNAPSWLWDP